MSRYVDFDELCREVCESVKRAREKCLNTSTDHPHYKIYVSNASALETLKDILDGLPTVDVVPTHHGEWIYVGAGLFRCSMCGEVSEDTNYCQQCGAKMESGLD